LQQLVWDDITFIDHHLKKIKKTQTRLGIIVNSLNVSMLNGKELCIFKFMKFSNDLSSEFVDEYLCFAKFLLSYEVSSAYTWVTHWLCSNWFTHGLIFFIIDVI
jgi:hypothetical protein